MKRVKQLSGRTMEDICLVAGLCSGPTRNTYSAPQTRSMHIAVLQHLSNLQRFKVISLQWCHLVI